MKNHTKKTAAIAITALLMTAGMTSFPQNDYSINSITAAAEEKAANAYTVSIQLMQFHSEGQSMGNAAIDPTAHITFDAEGNAQIELDLKSMTYLNKDGYMGWMKKVDEVVAENKYHYPTEIKTSDAVVLEEYTDVYDLFNDPDSDYVDANVEGKWYAKKIGIPLDFDNKEDEILVQVYVPVMESIMEGGGTKFAVLDIDWDTLAEASTLTGDANGDGAFDVFDVVTLQKWLLAVPDTHIADWKSVNFCEDDKLDVFDLCLMKRALLNDNK